MIPKAITAADLRNAALVMDHLGRSVDSFVDGQTGGVCLDGAIRLATQARLIRYDDGYGSEGFWALSEITLRTPRRMAATEALAEMLPDRCTVDHDVPFSHKPGWLLEGDNRVYHYSDFICTGTEDSSALLVQAAEKLEAEL